MVSVTKRIPLVGREHELGALVQRVAAARSGAGGVTLIGGEPGIGKSRIVQELSEQAEELGLLVLAGRSYESSGMAPYLPFAEALGGYIGTLDPAALGRQLRDGAADVALILDEIRIRQPDLAAPPERSPEAARFALFESVTALLIAAARERGALLLILDDLHWADTPSLLLLQHIAARVADEPVLVVGTYRPGEVERAAPLKQTLASLARGRGSDRVLLGGLLPDEVARFVASSRRGEADPGLLAVLNAETEGNPFFLSELLALLAQEGRLDRPVEAWQLSIPRTVGEVIGRRLEHLSDACRRTLLVAAVLGRAFDLFPLRLATDMGPEPLLDSLEEAELAGVIVPAGTEPGRYTFAHPLIRKTIYESMPASRRVRLHRQVGEALERLSESNPDAYVTELANHFFQAAPGGEIARALRYGRRAGERSLAQYAYEDSAKYYGFALQALALEHAEDPLERCDLLLGLAEAQTRGGEMATAKENFRRAGEIADAHGLPERLALAGLGYAGYRNTFGRADPVAVDLLEKAVAIYGDRIEPLRSRVLARLAMELYYGDSRARREELSALAVDIARRTGDAGAHAAALIGRHHALHDPENTRDRLATASELAGLAERAADRELLLQAHYSRFFDLLELGESEAADRELTAHARLAGGLRQPLYTWRTDLLLAMKALLEGRLEEAERVGLSAFQVADRAQIPNALLGYGTPLFVIRLDQGRLGELEEQFTGLLALNPSMISWRCGLGVLYAETGRLGEARTVLDQLLAEDLAALPRDENFLVAVGMYAVLCDALGEVRPALQLYELALPFADRVIVYSGAVCCQGSVARHLGQLAGLLGRWEAGEAHLAVAEAVNTRLRARPLLARTRRDHALLLLRRGRPADRRQAQKLVGQALAAAESIGMARLTQELRSMADGTFVDQLRLRGGPQDAARAATAVLSDREIEVLRMLAAGSTNREIADALFLSSHTVDHHIANIYKKIGVRRRADATTFAVRHGLDPAHP